MRIRAGRKRNIKSGVRHNGPIDLPSHKSFVDLHLRLDLRPDPRRDHCLFILPDEDRDDDRDEDGDNDG